MSNPNKRVRITTSGSGSATARISQSTPKNTESEHTKSPGSLKRKRQINKLAPPRPFPTVPTSVSATGPRSAHKEGKNYICLTRKTPLGAYMRRCKEVILKDGYKTLHLSAMGAAIPHLVQLSAALPPILPFPKDEIHLEIRTGTVEVQDEVVPDDEDEDISYETRGKSSLMIILKIGEGDPEEGPSQKKRQKVVHDPPGATLQEPEQEEDEEDVPMAI